jgi:ATP-dependent RNA helicase RhlB
MSGSNDHLTAFRFNQFDLPAAVAQGIADAGFERCTPIQAQTLPYALAGRDVAGQAQTGTGKTAAFLIAAFNALLRRRPAPEGNRAQPRAFIVAPTRELAIQIHRDAETLGQHCGLRFGLAYGGTDYDKQRKTITAGCDVLIGTPGRLIDYLKQGVFDLRRVEVVVLDEADRMFDLGFIADVRYLLRRMPGPYERLSMLFSATLSYRVTELAFEHMNHPVHLQSETDAVTGERVEQVVYHPANDEKIALLVGLLQRLEAPRALVFLNTKRGAQRLERYLRGNGIEAAILSGDVPQRKRQRLLGDFEAGRLPVVLATDVAARGLHIPDVTHVFNFDLPPNGEDYVHRIGRTARAGQTGRAVSFACEDTAFYLPDIETYLDAKLPSAPVTAAMLPELAPPARADAGKKGAPRRARLKASGAATRAMPAAAGVKARRNRPRRASPRRPQPSRGRARRAGAAGGAASARARRHRRNGRRIALACSRIAGQRV